MVNRTQAPPINAITAVPAIKAHISALSNRLKVHVLPGHLQPVLRLDIVFPAGRWFEPSEAVAHLTSKMLLEGTAKHSATEIAEIISFYGASLTCQANGDWSTFSLHCLSKHFEPLLHLIKEILEEVNFPESEFDQLKTRTAQSVAIEQQKNSYLASVALSKKLFGANHPYQAGFSIDAIEGASLTDVELFYKQQYLLGSALVFLSGDVSEGHLDLLAELAVNGDQPAKQYNFEPGTSHGIVKVEGANSLQSAIHFGRLAPAPGTTDYFNLMILNEALGGYFGSRLMKNIREDKGLTYGIFSQLAPRARYNSWHIRTEVKGDKSDLAHREIEAEFAKLREAQIPKDELELVKNNLLGKLVSELTTPFDQLEWYKFHILHNLPSSYLPDYVNAIHGATASELQSLAKEYLKIESWVGVITSD